MQLTGWSSGCHPSAAHHNYPDLGATSIRFVGIMRSGSGMRAKTMPIANGVGSLDDNEMSSAVRLITSRGDLRQDVCGLLRRMSLTDNGVASLAVRYAMNAISYLYLRRTDEAMLHQMRAVSALQGAIDRIQDPRCRAQAIAASLLLSLYEVYSIAALMFAST